MGTRYKGSEAEVRALNAFITLTRAADSVFDATHGHLRRYNLTPSQFGALEALYHCGALYQGDLCAKMMRSSGSMTTLIAGLEKRKLLERERAKDDGRYVHIKLTPEGRKLIEKVLPDHVMLIARRFAAISPNQQDELREICRRLGKGQ